MMRTRTVASASSEALKAFRPLYGAPSAGNAAHEPRRSTVTRSRRFNSTATAVQHRDHALDLVVRGEASRQDGPSPEQNPAVDMGRIAQRREVSTASASSAGRHGEHVIVEAAQHATNAGAHRVNAGPRGCHGDAASAAVGAEYITTTRPGGLDGRSGRWVAQLARVLGRSLTRSRADTPGFFTKSVRVFGLHAGTEEFAPMADSSIPGYSQCYVRYNRRYTQNNSGSIAVLQGGDLATVANSEVARLVADLILHPPGAAYVPGPTN